LPLLSVAPYNGLGSLFSVRSKDIFNRICAIWTLPIFFNRNCCITCFHFCLTD